MTHKINKQAVAQAFGRAADGYDRFANFQRCRQRRKGVYWTRAAVPAGSVGAGARRDIR